MMLKKIAVRALVPSVPTSIIAAILFLDFFGPYSFIEIIISFVLFFVTIFAVVLFAMSFEIQLYKGDFFKQTFMLSAGFLLMSLLASFQSLENSKVLIVFLPFVVIPFLTMMRCYRLMLSHADEKVRTVTRIRDLSLKDQALVGLELCSFFVFLFLTLFLLPIA